METTCAACMDNFVTNLHPWWYDVTMVACLVLIVGVLALVNWTRFTSRSHPA